MRIKMPAVRIAQDSDTGDSEGGIQDILTCGSCQKTFALGDIVRFIQHKVLQCNKENYGQCYSQAQHTKHINAIYTINLLYAYITAYIQHIGNSADKDSDDGRPLSLANSRRPSISAPITKRPTGSRVHTPPPSSPGELLRDGASSTPKRLEDENTPKRRASTASSQMGSSMDDDDNKPNSVDIKQEHMNMDTNSSHEEESSISSGHPMKKSRTEVADAESNTTNSVGSYIQQKSIQMSIYQLLKRQI